MCSTMSQLGKQNVARHFTSSTWYSQLKQTTSSLVMYLILIAMTNQRDFYIKNNVEVTDAVSLVVLYFVQVDINAYNLGSLTTNITVIGEPKHSEWYRSCCITWWNVSCTGQD